MEKEWWKDSSNIEKEVGTYLISKHKLGEGGSSIVKLGYSKSGKYQVAVKVIAKYRLTTRGRENLENELKIHSFISKFNHPNICNMYEVIETNQHFFIFLEYVGDGDLVTYIESKGKIPEEEAKLLFREVMEAIQFLHSNSIVHRDIKAENFLVKKNEGNKAPTLKLTDFGLSDWVGNAKSFSTPCGSPCYTAPEIIERKNYRGEPTDVWSAGILLYALLIGEFPFSHPNIIALFEQIKRGQYTLPATVSDEAKDLITKLLAVDASRRITVEQCLDHVWLRKTEKIDENRLPRGW